MRVKLLVLFLSLLFSFSALAQTEKSVVRVGISNQNFTSQQYKNIKFSSESEIKIVDMTKAADNTFEIKGKNRVVEIQLLDGLYEIYLDDELYKDKLQGPLLISSNTDLQILGLNRKGSPAKYKGMLEIRTTSDNQVFNVINVVDMQNYLKGVVPNEMPVSFGLEALKAQAIAAKNYVTNAQINPNFDVVDSTSSQVYYGSNSDTAISSRAIDETKGIYALYNGTPISALYFSTSSGITDDWDDVFSNGFNKGRYPYLKAKIDKGGQKFLKSEEDAVEFINSKNGLDSNSPKFRWTVEFDRKELEEILNTTLAQQSQRNFVYPSYNDLKPLEGLKGIKVLKRTKSGKATEILISSKSGDYTVKNELVIRRVLKKASILPSATFYVETSGEEEILEQKSEELKMPLTDVVAQKETKEVVKEAGNIKEGKEFDEEKPEKPETEAKNPIKILNYVEKEKYPKTFKIVGAGFGHGVGMSQYGAYNMSKCGKKYPDILHYYYTNINISTLPKTVLYNEWNVWYKTEFYFDKNTYKDAFLIIDNSKGATEFPFKINDYDFDDTRNTPNNRILKMNITEYLNQGLNIVNFAPLNKDNRGKSITYRIELL